jgi:hypothetical protein
MWTLSPRSPLLRLVLGLVLIIYTSDALFWAAGLRRIVVAHRIPTRVQASSFADYKAFSSELLGNNSAVNVEAVCAIANELMRRDLVAEADQTQLRRDLQREALANQTKSEAEALVNQTKLEAKLEAKALAIQTNLEFTARAREALRMQQLSELSQRSVLEAFFRDVACCIESDVNVFSVLSNSTIKAKKQILRKGMGCSMTSINEALQHSAFKDAVWRALKLSDDIVVPQLTNSLLYGDLSGAIHSPALTEVYVRKSSRGEYKDFFSILAARFRPAKSFVVYSDMEAALGDVQFRNLQH